MGPTPQLLHLPLPVPIPLALPIQYASDQTRMETAVRRPTPLPSPCRLYPIDGAFFVRWGYTWACVGPGRASGRPEVGPTQNNPAQARPGSTKFPPSPSDRGPGRSVKVSFRATQARPGSRANISGPSPSFSGRARAGPSGRAAHGQIWMGASWIEVKDKDDRWAPHVNESHSPSPAPRRRRPPPRHRRWRHLPFLLLPLSAAALRIGGRQETEFIASPSPEEVQLVADLLPRSRRPGRRRLRASRSAQPRFCPAAASCVRLGRLDAAATAAENARPSEGRWTRQRWLDAAVEAFGGAAPPPWPAALLPRLASLPLRLPRRPPSSKSDAPPDPIPSRSSFAAFGSAAPPPWPAALLPRLTSLPLRLPKRPPSSRSDAGPSTRGSWSSAHSGGERDDFRLPPSVLLAGKTMLMPSAEAIICREEHCLHQHEECAISDRHQEQESLRKKLLFARHFANSAPM
ncbi:uncharacterized protein [Lolium perenne]|uniref:uncharacterized protein n=1 Tax=Lolium perenne TaxID=4522 RepID=UPI0021F64C0B|nr:uncharacterized protein LOC127310199 [Lolium perenne]